MSVVAGVSMVGKSVAMVETVAVVGIPVVVVGIGIGFRSSLGIRRSLAIVVAVETAIDRGESVQRTSVDGGHSVRGSHKRVAVVGISISSGLGISRPLAIVVSKGIGVSVVAVSVAVSVGESMAVVVAKVVAVAVAMGVVGVSISIGLSCHGSKEAQSSNGLKMKLEFGKSYREDLKRKFCYQKFSPRISS